MNRASSDKANENKEQDLLLQNVKTYIKAHHLSSKLTAKRDERGVVLVLQEAVLFQTGKADVLKNAELGSASDRGAFKNNSE